MLSRKAVVGDVASHRETLLREQVSDAIISGKTAMQPDGHSCYFATYLDAMSHVIYLNILIDLFLFMYVYWLHSNSTQYLFPTVWISFTKWENCIHRGQIWLTITAQNINIRGDFVELSWALVPVHWETQLGGGGGGAPSQCNVFTIKTWGLFSRGK